MNHCDRFGKLFRGCRFEPRYDMSPADLTGFTELRHATETFMNTLRTTTYVRDVCVTCGKTIEREGAGK